MYDPNRPPPPDGTFQTTSIGNPLLQPTNAAPMTQWDEQQAEIDRERAWHQMRKTKVDAILDKAGAWYGAHQPFNGIDYTTAPPAGFAQPSPTTAQPQTRTAFVPRPDAERDGNDADGGNDEDIPRGNRPGTGTPGTGTPGTPAPGTPAHPAANTGNPYAPGWTQNFGMLTTGTPMANGIPNSQVIPVSDGSNSAAQAAYNNMQGGGNYGGMISSHYGKPFAGVTNFGMGDNTATPGTNLSWTNPNPVHSNPMPTPTVPGTTPNPTNPWRQQWQQRREARQAGGGGFGGPFANRSPFAQS